MSFHPHACIAALVLAVAVVHEPAESQVVPSERSSTLRGVIVSEAEGRPLGYATVSLEPLGAERFADAQGRFAFTGLPNGTYRIRARQLGFKPADTVVVVSSDVIQSIRIGLKRVVVRLATVRVTGPVTCTKPGPPDPVSARELALIFEEIRENAERYRLLADSYPVAFRMERSFGEEHRDGTSQVTSADTILIRSDYHRQYRPGDVISREVGPRGKPEYSVHLPLLRDFADTKFIGAHCFTYAGIDSVDGTEYVRVDFRAAARLKGPDVDGEMYLDPSTFQLYRLTIRLTKPPTQVRGVTGVMATTTFVEIIPSVIVTSLVLGTSTIKAGPTVSMTETQVLLDYVFLKSAPGAAAPP